MDGVFMSCESLHSPTKVLKKCRNVAATFWQELVLYYNTIYLCANIHGKMEYIAQNFDNSAQVEEQLSLPLVQIRPEKLLTQKIRNTNSPIKVLSLFSGCGGLDLGIIGGFDFRQKTFAPNHFNVVFSNDIDSAAQKVYNSNKKYFNNHDMFLGDIKDVQDAQIPDFEILTAGFPCQPFSNAGQRKGIHDERGTLFEECERILKIGIQRETKPLGFIFENVRGIMSSKMPDGTTVPEEIKKRMAALGFNVTQKLIRASNYGVPSDRYRFIMIGIRQDIGVFDFSFLDDVVQEFGIASAEKNNYELLLGSILCDIPDSAPNFNDYWKYSPSGQYMIEKIGPCESNNEILKLFSNRIPIEKMPKSIGKGRSWKDMNPDDMSPRFRRIWDDPKKYHAPNFYRRFALGEINGTITASAQPENCGITHPFLNRRFTVREIARIQSFPDDFVFPYSTIANAYKVIGNAVPPILGWVIARALQKFLGY